MSTPTYSAWVSPRDITLCKLEPPCPNNTSTTNPPLLPRVYLKLVVSAEKSWLEERLKLDGEEVEAAMWLSPVLARLVAEAEIPVNCPSHLEVTLLDTTGQQSRVYMNPRVLTNMVSLLASLYPDYTKTTAITGTRAGS